MKNTKINSNNSNYSKNNQFKKHRFHNKSHIKNNRKGLQNKTRKYKGIGGTNQNNTQKEEEKEEGHPGIVKPLFDFVVNISGKAIAFGTEKLAEVMNVDIDTETQSFNDILGTFNEKFHDPETREKLEDFVENTADISLIVLDGLKEPIKEATSDITEIAGHTINDLTKQGIKTGLDAVGMIPVFGEVVEGVRVFDDVVKAAQSTIKATSKTVTVVGDMVNDVAERAEDIADKIKSIQEKASDSLDIVDNVNVGKITKEFVDKSSKSLKNTIDDKVKKTIRKNITVPSLEKNEGGGREGSSYKIGNRIRKTLKRFHNTNHIK